MQRQLTPDFRDYELIDSGSFEKLERFGRFVTRRPEPQAIWRPSLPEEEWRRLADASFRRDARQEERGEWRLAPKMPDRWTVEYAYGAMRLRMRLGLTSFKHVGIFPEQAANWNFIYDCCRTRCRGAVPSAEGGSPAGAERAGAGAAVTEAPLRVLNLFAYTGGATVACAKAGAEVTHVDAAKGMVERAGENARLSGIRTGIRYIIDDCAKFVRREIRRGNRYDAIVMDPPSYGRGPGGEMWKIEDSLFPFVKLCTEVLSDKPLFFLINSYTTGLQPMVLHNILKLCLAGRRGKIDAYEVGIATEEGIPLPCGAGGMFTDE